MVQSKIVRQSLSFEWLIDWLIIFQIKTILWSCIIVSITSTRLSSEAHDPLASYRLEVCHNNLMLAPFSMSPSALTATTIAYRFASKLDIKYHTVIIHLCALNKHRCIFHPSVYASPSRVWCMRAVWCMIQCCITLPDCVIRHTSLIK